MWIPQAGERLSIQSSGSLDLLGKRIVVFELVSDRHEMLKVEPEGSREVKVMIV